MDKPFPAYRGDEPYVFVCYAHEDSEAVYPILSQLHGQGIRVWYDEGISPGTIWRAELAEKIENAAVFLVFVSEAFGNSPNCEREVYFALERKRRALPVYLDEEKLPGAMELSLGGFQAIHRAGDTDDAFRSRIHRAIETLLAGGASSAVGPVAAKVSRTGRWVPTVVVATTILVIAALWSLTRSDAPLPSRPVIAVLPYTDISKTASLSYISEGLAEEILYALAQSADLDVIAKASSFWFKDSELPLLEIAEKLGATHLLSGSIRSDGDRLRISNQLIRASDQKQIWSERFDDASPDLFGFQEDVASEVAAALNAQLAAPSVTQRTNEQIKAYDYYLKAKHALEAHDRSGEFEIGPETLMAIRENLGQAMDLDPDLDLARLMMARTYLDDPAFKTQVTESEFAEGARSESVTSVTSEEGKEKVLSFLRPSDARYTEYHRLRAALLDEDDSNGWAEYESHLRAVLALDSNDIHAISALAQVPSISTDEKLRLLRRRQRLDPLNVWATLDLIDALKDNHPDEAIEIFHGSYRLNPSLFDRVSTGLPLAKIAQLHLSDDRLDSGLAWAHWAESRHPNTVPIGLMKLQVAKITNEVGLAREVQSQLAIPRAISEDPFGTPEALALISAVSDFQIAAMNEDWESIDRLYSQYVPESDFEQWNEDRALENVMPMLFALAHSRDLALQMQIADLILEFVPDPYTRCGAKLHYAFACFESGDGECAKTYLAEYSNACGDGPGLQFLSLANRITPGSRQQELAEKISSVDITMDERFLYPQWQAINRYLLEREDFRVRVTEARTKRDVMVSRYEAAKADGTVAELRFRPGND